MSDVAGNVDMAGGILESSSLTSVLSLSVSGFTSVSPARVSINADLRGSTWPAELSVEDPLNSKEKYLRRGFSHFQSESAPPSAT